MTGAASADSGRRARPAYGWSYLRADTSTIRATSGPARRAYTSAMARAQTTGDEAAAPEIAGPGNDSHLTQLLYGGGVAFTNSAGVPWTAAYVDTIGDPTCDLRSNIAAEARAKITYERLINCTDDPGLREALGFLMTREVSHQKSFEKALYSIEPNFPPGKLPGVPPFV